MTILPASAALASRGRTHSSKRPVKMSAGAHFLQIEFMFQRVQHGIVDCPGAVKAQNFDAPRGYGGKNDGEMLLLVRGQLARRFVESSCRAGAMPILLDQPRMAMAFA